MKQSFRKLHTKEKGGYMLVEILVSMMIFTIITLSSTTALLSIVDANAKSQSVKSVIDNLNVAVENMSRTVRIGTQYWCASDQNDTTYDASSPNCEGVSGISFKPQDAASDSDRITYFLCTSSNQGSTGCNQAGAIFRYRAAQNAMPIALTAPEVEITSLNFYVSGAGSNDGQPRVFMVINGQSGITVESKTTFNIQTTVSQRQTDSS